jgi:hypothetical protein
MRAKIAKRIKKGKERKELFIIGAIFFQRERKGLLPFDWSREQGSFALFKKKDHKQLVWDLFLLFR